MAAMLKTCNKCHKPKPLAAFSKRSRHRDGLDSSCKDCRAVIFAAWYKKVKPVRWNKLAERKEQKQAAISKTCSKCKSDLPKSEFKNDSRQLDGLKSYCKKCAYKMHRAWVLRNKEYVNEAARKTRVANPERYKEYGRKKYHAMMAEAPELIRERRRSYLDRHPEYVEKKRIQNRESRIANAEQVRQYMNAWRKEHPERRVADTAIRRARKTEAGGEISPLEIFAIKHIYGFTCLCCGKSEPEIKLTADHVIPIVKGGKTEAQNIQPLCVSCNARKHDDDTDYRPFIVSVIGMRTLLKIQEANFGQGGR